MQLALTSRAKKYCKKELKPESYKALPTKELANINAVIKVKAIALKLLSK